MHSPILKNDKNQTLYGQSRPLGNGNYEIKLNAKELSAFSQERQTLTIMHEVLHSYFRLLYDSQNDLNGHTRMLTNYIEQMACSLEGLFPNLIGHHDVAIALCFDNLKSSPILSRDLSCMIISSKDDSLSKATLFSVITV